MKTNDLLMVAAAGAAVFFVARQLSAPKVAAPVVKKPTVGTTSGWLSGLAAAAPALGRLVDASIGSSAPVYTQNGVEYMPVPGGELVTDWWNGPYGDPVDTTFHASNDFYSVNPWTGERVY